MKLHARWLRLGRAAVAVLLAAGAAHGATYYLDPVHGSDQNPGTSPPAPWRTLARADQVSLHPGDQLLLAAGQTFTGQLAFANASGTAAQPILISSYAARPDNGADQAVIDARGFVGGVCLKNCAHFEVSRLTISANAGGMRPGQPVKPNLRCGVLVMVDQPGEYVGFTLSRLAVRDVFFEAPGFVRGAAEVASANGTQAYGWGIRFIVAAPRAVLRDVRVTDCQIANVGHTGLQFSAPRDGLQDVIVQRVRIHGTGGPGVQMSGVSNGRFSELDVNHSGSHDDSRKWGRGSGLWTWNTRDVVIEHGRFQNAGGPGDSCGVHIDYNCRDVLVQDNFSANNAGGFCEILGNNHNCAYRYNISVNDGDRVKGRDGAFQSGKTFWLSGYTGNRHPQEGPFNTYFYNNTIFVDASIVANISIAPTTRGLVIANNIFHLLGGSAAVAGDQNQADRRLSRPLRNVIFKNNLFLRPDDWPVQFALQDQAPIHGDPGFLNAGGLDPADYTPSNAPLVRHRGIPIPRLPGDPAGLAGGLEQGHDILGRLISGNPGLGAVVMSGE